MIPIKRKQLVEQLASELGIDKELVDDIISYYYKNIVQTLSSIEDLYVDVPGLGVFFIKAWTLEKKIDKFNKLLKNMKTPKTMQAYAIRLDVENNLTALETIQEKLNRLTLEKKNHKKIRKQYEVDNPD